MSQIGDIIFVVVVYVHKKQFFNNGRRAAEHAEMYRGNTDLISSARDLFLCDVGTTSCPVIECSGSCPALTTICVVERICKFVRVCNIFTSGHEDLPRVHSLK